jgi:hypothetical protein
MRVERPIFERLAEAPVACGSPFGFSLNTHLSTLNSAFGLGADKRMNGLHASEGCFGIA